MARSTTPPGQLGDDARSGVPGDQGGATNAEGITPEMRTAGGFTTSLELDAGPERGERGEYLPRTYPLAIPERPIHKPQRTKKFIRRDS